MKIGFDHNKYIQEQSKYILEKVNNFDKLYLNLEENRRRFTRKKEYFLDLIKMQKIKLLQSLRDNCEVIICVYSGDIVRNKIRGRFWYYI